MLHMASLRNSESVGSRAAERPAAAVGPSAAVAADPVLAAGYDVLLDVGPGKATMAEVARRAGISRMTLYRRHDQMRTLISEVLTAELAVVMADSVANAGQAPGPARVADIATGAARAIAEHPLMLRLIELDPATLLPLLVTRRGSTQRAAESILADVLASEPGLVLDAEADVVARTIVTAASAFVFTESLARAEGVAGDRWPQFHRMIEGYLT
ncbi:MAG: TetR family transcriptional regulator [Actinobacteria bacterium]|nr:MAG: TetR family transcriptional regulator [Actinomycetota bacterium]